MGEVTSNTAEVSQVSDETNTGSKRINERATELSKLAKDLNSMGSKFDGLVKSLTMAKGKGHIQNLVVCQA